MAGTIVLVGCADVAALVRQAGFRVHQTDYFWGTEAVDQEWVTAIVDSKVGGHTGLAVAERLRRRFIVPLVLYGAEERDRVLGRFLGVERSSGGVRSEFYGMLDLCVREAIALREAHPAWNVDGREETVADSMILAVAPAR